MINVQMSYTDMNSIMWAVTAMRHPFESYDKSDTRYIYNFKFNENAMVLGDNDLKLMHKLINAGGSHSKFLRVITCHMDINAPLYWWKEFDTYKVGTVSNSTSTMHSITKREFTKEDFSFEHTEVEENVIESILSTLNDLRDKYLATKDKKYWYSIIQLLPSSYMQLRTISTNYQVLKHIYEDRHNHKLQEWRDFCVYLENMQTNYNKYFNIICLED